MAGDLLASVADLQAMLGMTVDSAKATVLLEAATATVQAAAGGQRIVQVVNDVVTLDLDSYDDSPYLPLPQVPVTAVGAVLVGATAVTDAVAELRRARLWRSLGWRSATLPVVGQPSTVTVTYTHGYPAGDQRLQLARAMTLSLAASGYSTSPGVVREQIDDYSVAYANGSEQLPDGPRALLRRTYGRPGGSVRLTTC